MSMHLRWPALMGGTGILWFSTVPSLPKFNRRTLKKLSCACSFPALIDAVMRSKGQLGACKCLWKPHVSISSCWLKSDLMAAGRMQRTQKNDNHWPIVNRLVGERGPGSLALVCYTAAPLETPAGSSYIHILLVLHLVQVRFSITPT